MGQVGGAAGSTEGDGLLDLLLVWCPPTPETASGERQRQTQTSKGADPSVEGWVEERQRKSYRVHRRVRVRPGQSMLDSELSLFCFLWFCLSSAALSFVIVDATRP